MCRGDNISTLSSFKLLEPSGLFQACNGIAVTFFTFVVPSRPSREGRLRVEVKMDAAFPFETQKHNSENSRCHNLEDHNANC